LYKIHKWYFILKEKNMQLIKLLFLLGLTNFTLAATVPDYEKEARWVDQVDSGLMDGEIITISGADKDFIGIWTESEEESKQTAIVIHGLGVHPDWSGVINPLRVSLTTQKYNTLSIQMPVLANGIEGKEYVGLLPISTQRIAVAVDYLEQEGYVVDLIVAHSLGSTMASTYLADTPHPINKYIAVGANAGSVENLKKINIKVLDLYGNEDIDGVMSTNAARKQAASHNKNYTQVVAEGNHFFTDNNDNLIEAVHSWLNKQK
jgi:hypothetical protein